MAVRICAQIIPALVHVFLVYFSFSVKTVTRRCSLVSKFQNFRGEELCPWTTPTGDRGGSRKFGEGGG